ncbi:hypothetical protein E8E14_009789 [Neopestalotiopsis sp. 37M]|nr:hypothetical protein E8E14_009789 [Neopestalotiopsis sp. 37M]
MASRRNQHGQSRRRLDPYPPVSTAPIAGPSQQPQYSDYDDYAPDQDAYTPATSVAQYTSYNSVAQLPNAPAPGPSQAQYSSYDYSAPDQDAYIPVTSVAQYTSYNSVAQPQDAPVAGPSQDRYAGRTRLGPLIRTAALLRATYPIPDDAEFDFDAMAQIYNRPSSLGPTNLAVSEPPCVPGRPETYPRGPHAPIEPEILSASLWPDLSLDMGLDQLNYKSRLLWYLSEGTQNLGEDFTEFIDLLQTSLSRDLDAIDPRPLDHPHEEENRIANA